VKLVLRCHINISFYILFYIVLIVALFVFLSSLLGVKRLIALIIYFISSILYKSNPRYFLLYLRYISACYFRPDFIMLATYAF
jgi:type IV secretory pathway VirB3-like protein